MDVPIKILIVEDEMLIGAKISMFLVELGYEVTALLPRAEDALLHVQQSMPDIALLDIQLKGKMDGIALGQILHQDHSIPIVFLTANTDEQSFQQAKASKPYAFLSKPFRKQDLKRALELTISLMADPSTQEQESQPESAEDKPYILADRIFVRHNRKMIKILFDTILYIEAERNYCSIVTKDKRYLLTMPMKSLENKLPDTLFQRIHRSYIVNLSHIEEVEDTTVVVGAKLLPLSRAMREAFLKRIKTA